MLIKAIREGGLSRERAWEFMYKKWQSYYLSPVQKLGGNLEEVQEVMSIVVVSLDKRIRNPQFELHSASLRVYLTESVKRAWIKWTRIQGIDLPIEFNPEIHLTGNVGNVEDDFIRAELLERFDKLLNRLGERCKKILLLYANGYSFREIAKQVGFNKEQSAKNEKLKCRKKLVEISGEQML